MWNALNWFEETKRREKKIENYDVRYMEKMKILPPNSFMYNTHEEDDREKKIVSVYVLLLFFGFV